MAEDVVQNDKDMPGSGISDASEREPSPDPAATPDAGKTPAAATTTPDPKRQAAPSNQTKDNGAPTGAPAQGPDQGYDGSQFLPNATAQALKQALGIKGLDPHLEEMLRVAKLRLTNDKSGILIDMPQNGHSIHCGKMKDGTEFIGMPHKRMICDAHDAHVMVGLAKGRGWKAINVNGTQAEQETLWLEAMRQGLPVANFQPDPNSDVAKKWMEEYMAAPKPSVSEAQPEDFHLKTMQLLKDKAEAAQDKDAKAGFETVLKKFQEGTAIQGTADIFKGLSEALSDKNERDAYNKAADFLNKTDAKLAISRLEAAPVAQPAAKDAAPATTPPAAKSDAPAPT